MTEATPQTTFIHPRREPPPVFTEGVCGDGAAILRDGCMMTITDILETLNGYAAEVERLSKSMDAAAYADWLQHG